MVVNDNACLLAMRGALETIASELAPTGFVVFTKPGRTGIKTSGQASVHRSNQIDLDVDVAAGRLGVRALSLIHI